MTLKYNYGRLPCGNEVLLRVLHENYVTLAAQLFIFFTESNHIVHAGLGR